ncbi:MAG: NADH-quinone oxidoreductase subunit L [Verrucomicrobiota bacterium]
MNWVILLSPLVAALLITIGCHRSKVGSVALSIGACAMSFIGALCVFFDYGCISSFNWVSLPGLKISLGAMDDELARLMLLVVTGVGLLIHIFAIGYMKEDPGISRFFAKLSLFMFSMLGIVLADNLAVMFVFWELVGLSSYLLIGFWFQKPSAAEASKKAFIVNRIGDFGFILGILGVWGIWGALDFDTLASLIEGKTLPEGVSQNVVNLLALGLFAGCVGKSAQLPLHVWLPDAMEGPTPVSALIHAATMVAAGVYMLCRVSSVLGISQMAMSTVLLVGTITALYAALIALQQNDIKRVLAYSTLSQLGYMVAAVGAGASEAAMFHLTTHAFFKALLFLGAGSIIHALHHEQDMWKMGGLAKKMPWTFGTFTIGTFALTGFPLLAGFFSKESILLEIYHYHDATHQTCFWILAFTAALTAFYMMRLWIVTFLGKGRSDTVKHAHESPWYMVAPLAILAVLSVVGGWNHHSFMPIVFIDIPDYVGMGPHTEGAGFVMAVSIILFLIGTGLGLFLYHDRAKDPIENSSFALVRLLSIFPRHKFFTDEVYEIIFVGGQRQLSKMIAWVDKWIVDGLLVRGAGTLASVSGEVLRLIQGGNVQVYVIIFILGLAFVCYWLFEKVIF